MEHISYWSVLSLGVIPRIECKPFLQFLHNILICAIEHSDYRKMRAKFCNILLQIFMYKQDGRKYTDTTLKLLITLNPSLKWEHIPQYYGR